MRHGVQVVAVALLLAAGGLVAFLLIRAGQEPAVESRPPLPPLVETLVLEPRDVPVTVRGQGTVRPRTESRLSAEVAGRVTWLSPSLVAGGWFSRGEPLVRLDRRDFELALARREAGVAAARLRLEQVRAEAGIARREWELLGDGAGAPLALREPQLAEARAALAAAQAELEGAGLDLERTTLRAPFEGRLSDESVEVGSFVARGQALATLHAVDAAEVRVPLADEELAFLDVPLGSEEAESAAGPEVLLRARFAGAERAWPGRLVRTEGEVDPRTLMVHAVVRVEDPYGRRGGSPEQPLPVGLFVRVEIRGRTLEGVFVVPRSAFRDERTILVVDDEGRAWSRSVEVARRERDSVLVSSGLRAGERVCLTPLDAVTEGMPVRLRERPAELPEGPVVERVGS